MRYVSSNVTLEDEVGQNALHFVVIDSHAKPLEGLGDAVQMDLRLANDKMDPLEEVAVANRLAFFQEQIRSPSNEEVLVFEKPIVEGAQIAGADALHERDKFMQRVLLQQMRRWEPPSEQFHRDEVGQDQTLVFDRSLVAVLKGVVQIPLRLIVLVLKHVEPTDEVSVRDHLSHLARGVQVSALHRSDQIFAQAEGVETKVHRKQLIHNEQNAGLFGAMFIERGTGVELLPIVQSFGKALL